MHGNSLTVYRQPDGKFGTEKPVPDAPEYTVYHPSQRLSPPPAVAMLERLLHPLIGVEFDGEQSRSYLVKALPEG